MAIKHGTAGADTLVGTSGADQLFGEGGNDVLKGLAGGDTLDGGKGRDTVDYGASAAGVRVLLDDGLGSGTGGDAEDDTYVSVENAVGSSGSDGLFGDGLGNRLDGGRGNDDLDGGAGNDTLVGGGGRDFLLAGAGSDAINGGGGEDSLSYIRSAAGVNVNLTSGLVSGGDAAGDTITGVEKLTGSSSADILAGNAAANGLFGVEGADRLFGFGGGDLLHGDDGADTMTGGDGADVFLFVQANESPTGFFSRDVILDFSHAQGDRIDLNGVDANAETPFSNDAFEFLGKDALVDAPGQITYTFENNTTVVQVNTLGGFDSAPEMEIQLQGTIDLVASDFLL